MYLPSPHLQEIMQQVKLEYKWGTLNLVRKYMFLWYIYTP